MTIRATLARSTRTATVNLPNGPGPSHVNMPTPGCWTLHLSWGGHTDELSLSYVRLPHAEAPRAHAGARVPDYLKYPAVGSRSAAGAGPLR